MIRSAIGKLTGWYMASWVFLLWSALCVVTGAAWMFLAVVAAVPPEVRDMLL